MRSLKEQLVQLFKKGKTNRKVSDKGGRSGDCKSKRAGESEAWKAGAEPLAKSTDRAPSSGKTSKPKSSVSPTSRPPLRAGRPDGAPPGLRLTKKAVQTTKSRQSQTTKPARAAVTTIRLPENQISDPPKTELSGIQDFRFPEGWVAPGSQLQLPGAGGGRILSVRIGVDFGTAYTKVAVRLADAVFAIDFSGITNRAGAAFLLPGEISLDSSKRAWIGHHPEAKETISGLKIPFLTTDETSLEGKINAALFLAWILRYTRAWIFRHQAQMLSGRTLAWELNVGIPSSSWIDQSLNRRYEAVVETAWQLSREDGEPSRERARELLLSKRQSLASLGLDDFQLVPEFVAQLAGYVLSPQRPEKGEELHLLVDIGAGTVDIACFGAYRYYHDIFYRFPTWASAVEPFGTHFLMNARCEGVGAERREWDDFAGVPNSGEFADRFECDRSRVDEIDEAFTKEVSAAISRVLTQTKLTKHPMAREWEWGIRTFLVGGGSHCNVYHSAVLKALKRIHTPLKEMKFELMELQNREQIDHDLMHRLSVAYGLTFDAYSIGEAISPEEIEDLFSPTHKAERPDRDELYPK